MVANLRTAVVVLLVLFSLGCWAQTNEPGFTPGAPQMQTADLPLSVGAFSSSKTAFSMMAAADMDPLAKTSSPVVPKAIIANPVIPANPNKDQKEYARKKKIWFSLMAVEHGSAAFDAWSTRAAVNRGAQEMNPFLKPFSHSAAMYPAAQVVPFGMDFLAQKMMRSNNHILRKLWWVPQAASTVASLTAGIHNMGVNTGR